MTPSSQPADLSDRVAALHVAVRMWVEHIPQTLPYVDLMFAFGFANLGDRGRAESLVDAARKVMVVPIPEQWQDYRQFEATVSAVTTNFLFKAFKYRIEQALAGRPHTGPLSDALLADWEQIATKAHHSGGTPNPYLRAEYVIGRMQEWSRVLEPEERVDVYRSWTKNQDALKKELAALHAIREPGELVARIRSLLKDGVPGKDSHEVQFLTLHEALPLAPRAGEAFTVDLVELVAPTLEGAFTGREAPDLVRKQAELLERALFMAGHYDRSDLVKKLVDAFVGLVRSQPQPIQLRFITVTGVQCLRSLRKLGMRDEIDRLLATLQAEVFGAISLAELRTTYAAQPEMWASVLQSLLNLAAGWLTFGLNEKAASILEGARNDLLNPGNVRLFPKDYTAAAQAYVTALGHGPWELGLTRITELFQNMDPRRITNTWTTAQYFSRFHLNLVEDVIFAVCPTGPEPHVVAVPSEPDA